VYIENSFEACAFVAARTLSRIHEKMRYLEILPSEQLRPYIKHYFYFESDSQATLDDIVFPSGHMEVIFNLGEGKWQSAVNDAYLTTPSIELWGQITKPLPIRSLGKHNMLGIRFYVHSAACFLQEAIWELNDQVTDARDLLGKAVALLHAQLLETSGLKNRIALVERYLLNRKLVVEKNAGRIDMIGQIVKELQKDTLPDNIRSLATKYRVTPRYLQKLFLQYTGFTPKFYHKINRFQSSLKLINKKESSLTSIAYDCGYFDQSHFIREFKSFTGVTPSDYTAAAFPVSNLLSNI
jgi:AraC-like DNA-binding protein